MAAAAAAAAVYATPHEMQIDIYVVATPTKCQTVGHWATSSFSVLAWQIRSNTTWPRYKKKKTKIVGDTFCCSPACLPEWLLPALAVLKVNESGVSGPEPGSLPTAYASLLCNPSERNGSPR